MGDEGFTAEQIDTSRPHPARMYDYYLGGQDNYEVDRTAAEHMLSLFPITRTAARENRTFLHRATRTVAERGIRQIIDIGAGIPTSPNTHEVARGVDPDVRVVYVDNDPIVGVYAGARLTNAGGVGFLNGDIRDPRAILDHPVTTGLIDFSQPVALLLCAVLHFVDDASDPHGLVRTLTDALPAGSFLVISHGTSDFEEGDGPRLPAAEKVYRRSTANLTVRDHAGISAFFEGFDLLEPGLVQPSFWRPERPVPDDPELRRLGGYCGVGVKR